MARKKGRRRKPFHLSLKPDTVTSIGSVVFFALAGVILLSFSGQGEVLLNLRNSLMEMFGITILILPFMFISAGLIMTKLNWKIAKPNVLLGAVLLFISGLGLLRSGTLGDEVFLNVSELISPFGAVIIFSGVAFVAMLIITESSMGDVIQLFANALSFVSNALGKLKRQPSDASGEDAAQHRPPMKIKGNNMPSAQPAPPQINKAKTNDKSANELEPLSDKVVANQPGMVKGVFKLPSMNILSDRLGGEADRGDINYNATTIEKTLTSFGITAHVVEVNLGPAVTQYALEINIGTKLSKITSLQNDLALALAAPTGQIRIEAPIPGKSLVGIEIPNRSPEMVTLKSLLVSPNMKKSKSKIAFGLGLDVSGEAVVADIARMPHVLVAGATGSGKSVCVNSIIGSILLRATPDEVKFIMVDPKRVELTQYNGIPHLLTPVIVEPEKVVAALEWAVHEMDKRYKLFAELGVRNIEGYNEMSGFQALPYLIIIIDELADVMLFAPSKVEECITRLAQMARATGIHLVLATQRPSVDVITGLIKANIPCRISFNVASAIDSRVILDGPGAEKLLGKGDMLYVPPESSKPRRIQGTFVADKEIKAVIDHLKATGVEPEYTEEVTTKYQPKSGGGMGSDGQDELFADAVRMVVTTGKASASYLQRRLSIGYARAARIMDQLEEAGIISAGEGSKPRNVLITDAESFLTGSSD
jgi:S-DNA-T family DNA segregation ATPase FtsK/SpoIIIE